MAETPPRLLLVSDSVRQQIDHEARLQNNASDKKELQRAKEISEGQTERNIREPRLTMILSNLEWRTSFWRLRASSSVLTNASEGHQRGSIRCRDAQFSWFLQSP